MNYVTVFEIIPEDLKITSFLHLEMFFYMLIVPLFIYQINKSSKKINDIKLNKMKNFFKLYITFVIIFCLLEFLGFSSDIHNLKQAYKNKTYKIVEGKIENFHPMPYVGHDTERFTINNIKFSYSDFSMQIGFHNSKSHGGPLDEGLQVRITYVDDTITKIEVLKAPNKALNTNM